MPKGVVVRTARAYVQRRLGDIPAMNGVVVDRRGIIEWPEWCTQFLTQAMKALQEYMILKDTPKLDPASILIKVLY